VAAVYHHRPPYPAETFDLMLECLPAPHGARVLELGAGSGEIAIPLATRVAKIDAVEPSSAMRTVAMEQPGSDQVFWHATRAESFSYPTVYDLIVCAQSLQWLDWEVVFPRFVGALDPGGWLLLVDQETFEDLPWRDDLSGIIGRFSTNQAFEPYNLVEELTSRGLFDVRGRVSTWPVRFRQSVDDYIKSLHARNGFSRDRMTPEAAAEFAAEVRALLLEYHPDGIIRGRNQAHLCWGKPRMPLP